MPSWDAVTAVSTAVTTVVLVVTVVLGRRQFELLRRSTQLDGLIRILAQLNEPHYVTSYRFVMRELEDRMHDPAFRGEIERGAVDEDVHRYLPILMLYEQIGAYVRYGLVDADAVYCQTGARAVRAWEKLRDVVAIHRARSGPGAWDSYEALVEGTIRYARKTNPDFPAPYGASRTG